MATTKIQLGIGAVVIAGAAIVLLLQQQTLTRLRVENDRLQTQLAEPHARKADDRAPAAATDSLSAPEQAELLRLRGEVTRLREQTNELAKAMEADLRRRPARPPSVQPATGLDPEAERARQIGIAKLNDAKLLMVSFHLYAGDNGDRFPTNFEQVAVYLGKNSLTGTNQFEQLYAGPMTAITNAATAIVVREAQASFVNGKWIKAYGFADGHAEIHSAPDGNFDAWEKEHSVQLKNTGP